MKRLLTKTNVMFGALLAVEMFWNPARGDLGYYFMGFLVVVHVLYVLRYYISAEESKKHAINDVFFVFYVLVFVWNIFTAKLDMWDSFLYPAPGLIVKLLINELPKLGSAFVSSIELMSIGFSMALLAGVSSGLLLGWRRRWYNAAKPLAKVLGPIPPVVYIPYAIAILPTFKMSSVFIVFIGAFWPIFINTLNGVFAIDKGILDSARAIHVRSRDMLLHIILPSCVPAIISGATIGLSFSFILLTSAEMIGSTNGMGWYVKYFSEFANYPKVFVGIIFIGAVVSGIMFFVEMLERYLLRWRKGNG
jgi:NitT/TauT family transport system permease protein